MAVGCKGCGYEMSVETAAAKLTDLFPPLGTAGGGYIEWASELFANGCNRTGVECPKCKQTGQWSGNAA
ncbi:MAG TPA: hypothetical protein VGK74_03925 [Symbiobacteriaceae bacterium]